MTPETVFDQLASQYDASFSERKPARWLRAQVREQIAALLQPNSRVLDLGCGTGDDALWLASAGHDVVATDVSKGMLAATTARRESAPAEVRARVAVQHLDAATPATDIAGPFDCVISNFGALNCCADMTRLFEWLDARVASNASVAFTIMGKVCLWEVLGFGLRGQFSRATRRWRRRSTFESGGSAQPVWYHSPASVRRMSGGKFEVERITGIGVLVPSTEFFGVCEDRPRLLRLLTQLEALLAGWWPFNRLGDHYLIVMRKAA